MYLISGDPFDTHTQRKERERERLNVILKQKISRPRELGENYRGGIGGI